MSKHVVNFQSHFLDFDFDKILIDDNNTLINSNEHYLYYKTTYLKTTQENLENYKNLNDKYISLTNNEFTTDTGKVKYYVSNQSELDNIKLEMNKIIMLQRNLYDNFINHIKFLNEHKIKLTNSSKKTQNKSSSAKKFFSKLTNLH